MKIDLYINEANDYAQDIGAPVYHPHVSVIHYDEVGEIRHTLNRINCYGIFLQKEFPEGLTYGMGTYHDGDGSLMAYSPGQIGGKPVERKPVRLVFKSVEELDGIVWMRYQTK